MDTFNDWKSNRINACNNNELVLSKFDFKSKHSRNSAYNEALCQYFHWILILRLRVSPCITLQSTYDISQPYYKGVMPPQGC